MSMIQALIDVRKLKRMTALIEQNDSDKAAEQLELILKEALAIQMTGNIRAQTNAIQELKSLRNAMLTGAIQAGKRTTRMVGAFTLASEEMERETLKLAQKTADERGVDLAFISDRLPSVDSLTSALITANPFIGYGVKILRDVARAGKQRKSAIQQQQQQRLELIQQQQIRIAELLKEAQQSSEDDNNTNSQDQPVKPDADFNDRLKPDETTDSAWTTLFSPWADDSKRLLEDIEHNTFKLAKIWDDSHERIVRINDDQEKESERLQRTAAEEEKRRLEQEREQGSNPPPPPALGDNPTPEEQKGGLAGILGGLLGGITTGSLMAAMGSIAALFAGLTSIGAIAGKILGRGSWLAAVFAIYELIDGFFTAKDILGKSTVTIRERVEAGIANMLGNLGAMFDTVFNWFGLDIIKMSKDELVKGEAAMIHDLTQVFVDIWDGVVDFFIKMKDEILKFFDDPTAYMEEFMRNFAENSSVIQGAKEVLRFPTEEEQRQGRLEASTLTERLARGEAGQLPSLSNYPINNITQQQIEQKRMEQQRQSQPIVVSAPTSSVVNNNTTQVSSGGSPRNNDPSFRGILSRNYGNN